MAWYTIAIEDLKQGKVIQIRPHGNSMRPKICNGNLVTISPCDDYNKGDIVLVKVKGRVYVHLIKAIKGDLYCIGNNRGHINGWTSKNSIYGKVIKVEK